jgi:guanylate kinase
MAFHVELARLEEVWRSAIIEGVVAFGGKSDTDQISQLVEVLAQQSQINLRRRKTFKRRSILGISGPGASGKDSVISVLESDLPMHSPRVVTTRRPRPSEKGNSNYTFVSDSDFQTMESSGEFLRVEEISGRGHYGLPFGELMSVFESDKVIVLKGSPIQLQLAAMAIAGQKWRSELICVYLLPSNSISRVLYERARLRDPTASQAELIDTIGPRQIADFRALFCDRDLLDVTCVILNDDISVAGRCILDLVLGRP